ncbi:uncharacterized protein PHACADRAFT_32209 [Phanerochaete carnosa HHB-10118-sp]|uniref:DUF6589 domain-containing protein n=1 Tax=Phanerochaete carnosa (strain HHB-10118-sp) TaxID=650164 RepID=K5VX73_PHACS|nr:uncharacterized protein PHACADRAFT_32209 [Phanerochaete carnosa HHB-10118-sp]EKM51204.1 hypothetical protein PHACADRAFT_32209 [Phanerochaete carnosa HHB-10118-sp]
MQVDESSIDSTLEVIETLAQRVLKFTEADLQNHSVIICAGDQLTNSLVNKASACRRDDKDLLDNPSWYLKPQLGLFHVKMATQRMVANEHWAMANSSAPWSLWRMNSLLRRKPISAGWKAKKLMPFHPAHELTLTLVLPANVLDALCIFACKYSQHSTLEAWAGALQSHAALHHVAVLPDDVQDHTLENIVLFNKDTLILREYYHAVKHGDIGSIVNILAFWVHEFRGTGSISKYSEALLEVLMDLKTMDPCLCQAYKMSWL